MRKFLICLFIFFSFNLFSEVLWRSIGPGLFGAMFGVGISPHNPNIIVAGVDMGNVFMTEDGGKSWQIIGKNENKDGGFGNPGYRGVWSVCFDPKRENIIYIGSEHGLYKTIDKGKNWKLILGGDPSYTIGAIEIDPTDPNIIYAANGRGARINIPWARGRIWKSIDGGKNWKEITPKGLIEENRKCWSCIVIDPMSPFIKKEGHQRIYISGQAGFFVSEDGGRTWNDLEEFLPGGKINLTPNGPYTSGISTIFLAPGNKFSKIYASIRVRQIEQDKKTIGGVYLSEDCGKTWIPKNNGLEKAISGMEWQYKQKFPYTYSILVGCKSKPEIMYLSCVYGIYKTTDAGENWFKTLNDGSDWVKLNIDGRDYLYTLRKHETNLIQSYYNYFGPANGLAVCSKNPDIVAYTDNATIGVSYDGGKTWTEPGFEFGEAIWPNRFGDRPPMRLTHKVRSTGLQLIVPIDLAVDPFDPKTIAIGHCDIGLMISRDNGNWWEWAYTGIIGGEKNYIRAVLYDPEVKNRLWVAGGGWDSRNGVGHVYQSDDGGKTFKVIGIPHLEEKKGLFKRGPYINALCLDHNSKKEERIIYAGTDAGIYKTQDAGKTWEEVKINGKENLSVKILMLDSKNKKIYASVYGDYGEDSENWGLFVSEDGGKNWRKTGENIFGVVRNISIYYSKGIIYVVADEKDEKFSYWTNRSLWRSDDYGKTWKKIVEKKLIACVGCHPENPNKIYMVIFANDIRKEKVNVLKSLDGGKKWISIANNIPLSPGGLYNKIVFDPNNPNRFFLLHNSGTYECIDGGEK
ncbi:MAG: hypothetical protein NC922_08720 [Candidatus Omnitrophica bacterium]|nr:hypothetical protein [Candidatus Omnitrophota bacterium]